MSDLHEEPKTSSLSTLILISIIILALIYFLAKGCTNVSDDGNSSSHSAAVNRVTSVLPSQSQA